MSETTPQNPPTPPVRYDGPFGGILNHIPLQTRFSITIGVVIGVIASVIAGGIDTFAGKLALGIGIGAGLIAGIWLAVQSKK